MSGHGHTFRRPLPGTWRDDVVALLRAIKDRTKVTYDVLEAETGLARGTVGNYLNRPDHHRSRRVLTVLLAALRATGDETMEVLKLAGVAETRCLRCVAWYQRGVALLICEGTSRVWSHHECHLAHAEAACALTHTS